jgi:AraC-like DNA-binding protein
VNLNLTASRHILPVTTFLAANGETLEPLLQRAGLPSSCLEAPQKLVPTAALWRFRELAAARTGLDDLTLRAMEPVALSEIGPVGQSLLLAPTLVRTIRAFKRLARRESSTATLDLTPYRHREVFFSVRFSLPDEWQAELYLLMWMLKIVWLVDAEWSPTEIWCTASATPDRLRAIESLATRPRFNQYRTGFPIPTSMLALPQERSSGVATPLWAPPPAESASSSLKQMLLAYSDDRWLTLEEACDALGMNPRTLQRHLAADDTTYSAILDEVRAKVAGDLLENTDAPLSQISRDLGYSNPSNFNRAFRRWAAVLPGEFRAQRGSRAGMPGDAPGQPVHTLD